MDMSLAAYRRKWIHETVEDALAFYSRVFDEAPAAIITTDANFVITDANVTAQKLFQKTLGDLRGKPFIQSVAQADRHFFAAISAEIRLEPGRVTRPLLIRTPDNRESEVSLVACGVRGESGEPEMIIMIILERGENISSDML